VVRIGVWGLSQPSYDAFQHDFHGQWICSCSGAVFAKSISKIIPPVRSGTLGNGFDLLLDVGRIGTLWGVMSHYILPPFFLLQTIRAGTCEET
jgi:hypothetical protein